MGKWRIGRSLGRTIYWQFGDEPSKEDHFMGIMETIPLAQIVVDALNARDAGLSGPFVSKLAKTENKMV